mmetsp:Transcript_48475/g.115315  ORF Transcript_48475/g.115315 Transcript_48475/m.115315 type:complete len:364 (+) Transcript_48475:1022-2113(+)
MLPERLGRVEVRQLRDVVLVALQRAVVRNVVRGERGELEVLDGERLVAVPRLEVGVDQPPVPRVCHPPAVVRLADQVPDRLPRRVLVVVDVQHQHVLADVEVRVVEIVGDVPPEVLELPPLEQRRVEEAQLKHHLLILVRLRAPLELRFRELVVQAREVRLEPARRLRRHLQPALQDRHRELGGGRRGEPQAEGLVGRARRQLGHPLLELAHVADAQVAVGEEDPVPVAHALVQHPLCDRALPLPERQREELVADPAQLRLGLQHHDRVHPGGEHEDERRGVGRVDVCGVEVEGGRLHELGAEVVGHERRHREHHAVRAQEADQEDALQLVALVLPLPRERRLFRRGVLVPLVPVLGVLLERR